MASIRPLPSFFPESLRAALELREQHTTCPDQIRTRLDSMPYFKIRAPPSRPPTSRFGGLSPPAEEGFRRAGWRGPTQVSDDGFQVVRNKHHRSQGSLHSMRRNDSYETSTPRSTTSSVQSPATPTDSPSVARFSSAAVKATIDVDDRILAKVKGKINKIGHSTYDATKTFMQQILDSEETGFLDEFMKFVFQKAATESAFCGLYARLLHELSDEFTHLRTVVHALFRDYTGIFSEVESTPDVGSEDYKAFVDAQERKKFRRGYSQFVAELVKLGEVDKAAFGNLLQQIVQVLVQKHTDPAATLLCEEYIDCLANMCGCAASILSNATWAADVKGRLAELARKPRADVPGLTNKARFALMDLVEKAERGWK